MATQSASALVSRQLGTQFAHAAPDNLSWAHERQFFQLQVSNLNNSNKTVQLAIAHNDERTIQSIRDAAVACAAMGLTMNPIAALVYFIPRREREFNEELDKNQAEYEAKVPWIIHPTPSYRGLANICTRYAGADDVAAEIVFEAERRRLEGAVFELRGPLAMPYHRQTLDNTQRTYEQAIGVYCAIKWPGDRARCEYIDRPTVLYIRSLSKLQHSLMWSEKKLWSEGWKKAVVRRACKLAIQGNPRMDAAEAALRAAEGDLIDVADVPRGTPPQAEPTGRQRPRGMGGLRSGLEAAQVKERVANDEAATAERIVTGDGPVAQSVEQPEKPKTPAVDQGGELGKAAGSSPAGTSNPTAPRAGSIAWWNAKLEKADTRHALSELRAEAIAAGVDTGPDAAEFSANYTKRSREIRRAQTEATGGQS